MARIQASYTEADYSLMVQQLAKPGIEIADNLRPSEAHLLHMLLGLAGEVGELIDGIKKSVIYGKLMDEQNVVEELGDIEFYLQGIRNQMHVTRDECIAANVAKLSKRYKKGSYSNEAAVQRADKVGP